MALNPNNIAADYVQFSGSGGELNDGLDHTGKSLLNSSNLPLRWAQVDALILIFNLKKKNHFFSSTSNISFFFFCLLLLICQFHRTIFYGRWRSQSILPIKMVLKVIYIYIYTMHTYTHRYIYCWLLYGRQSHLYLLSDPPPRKKELPRKSETSSDISHIKSLKTDFFHTRLFHARSQLRISTPADTERIPGRKQLN